MDWMTPIGYLIGLGKRGLRAHPGKFRGLILNTHAILLVFGGTLGATLISYPITSLRRRYERSVSSYFRAPVRYGWSFKRSCAWR